MIQAYKTPLSFGSNGSFHYIRGSKTFFFVGTHHAIYQLCRSFYMQICYMREIFRGPYFSHIMFIDYSQSSYDQNTKLWICKFAELESTSGIPELTLDPIFNLIRCLTEMCLVELT